MTTIFFLFGLIIGSFLNSVTYRLGVMESLWERSHCPNCKRKVRWYDNIPLVSFVVLAARCRDCGEKISWRYPLLELLTGVVFALVGAYTFVLSDSSTWLTAAMQLGVFSLLLVIFAYDLEHMEIPMLVLWAGVALVVLYCLAYDLSYFDPTLGIMGSKLFGAALGGVVAFVFFFALARFSDETWMGYGDAYLGLLVGMVALWPRIIATLVLSFVIGSLLSIGLIAFRKKTMKSQVPFAPFLIAGLIVSVFAGEAFPQLTFLIPFFY